MKQLRLLGLMLMAVFALGASAAATASASERGVLTLKAEPRVLALGEHLENLSKLIAGGKTILCELIWILHLEMEPVAGSGEKHFNLSNKDLDIHFSKCKSEGLACNTPGDLKEVILVLTLVHLVNLLDKAGGKLVPGALTLVLNAKLENKPLVIECAAGILKIQVRGAAHILVEPLNAKKEITLTEEVEKVGVQAVDEVVCDKENEKVCEELLKTEPLEASFDGGKTFSPAKELTELETLTLNTDVLWDD